MNPSNMNAEQIITMALAAVTAQQTAWQTMVLVSVVLAICLIALGTIIFIAVKLYELEKNTNGIRAQLLAVTRKDALAEGELVGRRLEQADHKEKG